MPLPLFVLLNLASKWYHPITAMPNISRRQFGKLLMASSAASLISSRAYSANGKVNIAFIGCGDQGESDASNILRCKDLVNVIALCDVQFGTKYTEKLEKAFPNVPRFSDFRKMFDKMGKDIDACTVAVPDHSHFPITMLAMSLGKHVFVEKPLAHTFHECQLMMEAARRHKVVTQMGNQGHSGANYFQFKAWKEAGIIKDVTRVDAYMNKARRWHGWNVSGYPSGAAMPAGLNWDTWIGTAPEHPYDPKLHPGDWRNWFDYGMGAFGDWGPHILDTIHEFLELGMPEKITAVKRDGPSEFIFPQASTVRFDFPKRVEMPPVAVSWYDGVKTSRPAPRNWPLIKRSKPTGRLFTAKTSSSKAGRTATPCASFPKKNEGSGRQAATDHGQEFRPLRQLY